MTMQVYVYLTKELVDVWRPVQAEHLRDDIYRIVEQPYDRDDETWQFEPGDLVVCKRIQLHEGPVLAAVGKAPETGQK